MAITHTKVSEVADGADTTLIRPLDWNAEHTIEEIQLLENKPILLDAALSADGKYSGTCEAGTAGETLVFGNLVYLKAADSKWWKADSNASATSTAKLGICVLAADADAATTILLFGKVNAASLYPTLTIGAKVYVGETAGNIQVAAPTGVTDIIRVVGFANTADELFFAPMPSVDKLSSKSGIQHTRLMDAASGDVAYTGYGFLPTALVALANVDSAYGWSLGFVGSDGVSYSIFESTAGVMSSYTRLLELRTASGVGQLGILKSYDADGFTITWTKAGSPTGTGYFAVLALK